MGRELLGGLAAGLALVPALSAIASMMARGGMDYAAAYGASALSALLATLLLAGLGSPLAASPDAALAGWLSCIVILSGGHSWQAALGAAFLASCLALLAVPFRRRMAGAVPLPVQRGLRGGMGLLLVLLGLEQGRVLVGAPAGLAMLGDFADPFAFHTLLGILATALLFLWEVPGALFLGMAVVATAAFLQGFWALPEAALAWPGQALDAAFHLDLPGGLAMPDTALALALALPILAEGGRMALAPRAGGQPKGGQVTVALLGMNAAGACLGSFPLSPAPESAVGLAGARPTRRVALGAAAALLLALFAAPLAEAMASFGAITAAALVLAGYALLRDARDLLGGTAAESMVACTVLVLLPLARDLPAALGAGLALHVLLETAQGRGGALPRATWALAVLWAAYVAC